jgi:hypothetical protein
VSTDLPDEIGRSEMGPGEMPPATPGLDQFLDLLTTDPQPDELAGADAALAMFRAHGPPAPAPAPARPARVRWRMPRVRLAAAAAVIAVVGGFSAAAYAEALPGPVQHVAYRVLGFAGVPNVRHQPATRTGPAAGGGRPQHSSPAAPGGRTSPAVPGSAQPTTSAPTTRPSSPAPHHSRPGPARHSASPSPSHSPSPSATPSPSPTRSRSAAPPVTPTKVAVLAVPHKVTAGATVSIGAKLTGHGQPAPREPVSLIERTAAAPAWHMVAESRTDASGRAELTVADLTASAKFRVTGPDGLRSQSATVVVLVPVTLAQGGASGRGAVLVASSPLAQAGDLVVLQVQSGAGWHNLKEKALKANLEAKFGVKRRKLPLEYRVVLRATLSHGRSFSSPVTGPSR